MELKTILNRCHPVKGFVYQKVRFGLGIEILADVVPRRGSHGYCGNCFKRGTTYDTGKNLRRFSFIPFWGFTVVLLYCMRREAATPIGSTWPPGQSVSHGLKSGASFTSAGEWCKLPAMAGSKTTIR